MHPHLREVYFKSVQRSEWFQESLQHIIGAQFPIGSNLIPCAVSLEVSEGGAWLDCHPF